MDVKFAATDIRYICYKIKWQFLDRLQLLSRYNWVVNYTVTAYVPIMPISNPAGYTTLNAKAADHSYTNHVPCCRS